VNESRKLAADLELFAKRLPPGLSLHRHVLLLAVKSLKSHEMKSFAERSAEANECAERAKKGDIDL